VPPWVGPLFIVCAVVLLPWTAFLFITLPDGYSANHWGLAWGGFDVALGLALVITSVAIDILTSRGTSDIVQAIVSALVVELPLAILCFWIARNVNRAVESVRPWLEAAGFTIRDHKLVPPQSGTSQPDAARPE
jgi:hypothetical protein